jgi:putative lipoprotein (rSAM/lipoprotein system)
MKKAKIEIIKFYNVIIAGILSVLGFITACEPKAEYGTPSANFIVNGKITSSETNKPIENIQVTMEGNTKTTNTNGEFKIVYNDFPTDQTYNLSIKDTDGDKNLHFFDKDTIAQFKNPKFSDGDDHWYEGETEINIDVELTPKK